MSETKPGETTGSSHISSLNKDLETLEKIVQGVEKSHKGSDEADVLRKQFENIKRAVGTMEAGKTPIDKYNKVRTAVSGALQSFAKQAKALAKPKEQPKEDDAITFIATTDGAKELNNDKNAKMIQAVKNALDNAGGRSGPKIDGISKPFYHIHIGGNAKSNLLYRGDTMLGLIEFHIEKTNNAQQKDEVKKVANRTGSVKMKIEDDKIVKA